MPSSVPLGWWWGVKPELDAVYLGWLGKHLDDRWEAEPHLREEIVPAKPGELTNRDGFIQDMLRIRTKTPNQTLFRLNRVQREYSRRCREQNVVLKARQLGITTYIAARFFVQTISRPGTLSLQVTQDRESAEDIFRIVRRFWDNLPEYARKGILTTSYRNARQLVFPRLDSEYCLASAAENAGRGRTIQNLHCSEVSRWGPEGEEALASLRAAVVPGGDIVLESTANGAAGLFYEEWQRAEETGYTQHFFPWWFEDSYRLDGQGLLLPLTEDESQLVDAHGLSLEQIAWRRREWAALRGLAAQEFAEDPVACFRASGECVFELAALDQALQEARDPIESRDNGRLLIWLPRQAGRSYVIGVDPAGGGVEGDYSCAQVIDRQRGAQCAEFRGHLPPRELADKVIRLAKSYNTALVAVERNNHGFGVLATLEVKCYPNVFKQDDEPGWLTTRSTKPAMIETLASALCDAPGLFRSARLLQELRTFVRDRDGLMGGAPGTHDDCVMAMAVAWAVRAADAGQRHEPRINKHGLIEK